MTDKLSGSPPLSSTSPLPSRGDKVMDRLKGGAGVIAAVVGSMTALYGVYEKVRSDAKEYTATSYDTLAPKLNEMNDALKKLQQENQQLKEVVVGRRPAAAATPRPSPSAKPARATAAGQRPAPVPGVEPAPPPAAPPAVQATGEPAPAVGEPDRLNDIFGAVNQARDAVQTIRKVPETFEKAMQQQKK